MGRDIKFERQADGSLSPVPVYTPPITKDRYEQDFYDALGALYECRTDSDGNILESEQKYVGWTRSRVMQDRKAQGAAEGKLDFMKQIDDRVLGKPVQPTVNTNLTMTAHEYLNELPNPPSEQHMLLGFLKNPCPGVIVEAEAVELEGMAQMTEIDLEIKETKKPNYAKYI